MQLDPTVRSRSRTALRTVAAFEAAKGALVIVAGIGALSLVHHDVRATAEEIIEALGFNPAGHYPAIFLDAAARVHDRQLLMLGAGAVVYAAVRLAEAYGLWRDRAWAEWLGAVGGGLYLPFEVYEIVQHASAARFALFAMNLFIVGFLAWRIGARRSDQPGAACSP